eukprot:SAG22_NODE_27_length_29018_cov_465.809646_35_plen_125_part_00
MEVHIAKYKAIKGGSYIKTPDVLATKRAIINVNNTDHECFKWSMLAAAFPPNKHHERVVNYTAHQDKLDFSEISSGATASGSGCSRARIASRSCGGTTKCAIINEALPPDTLIHIIWHIYDRRL